MLFENRNESACVFIMRNYDIPTPDIRTQEEGGLGDPLIALTRPFVVLMRLEKRSFL